jgi:hypothetical protein
VHYIERRLETSAEELVFGTAFGIVKGCTYIIFHATFDDLIKWGFFHSDANMIDFLLQKSSFHHIHSQALAPDACRIHAPAVLPVDARALNAHRELLGVTSAV